MKCPKCNAENPDTAKFCNECGEKLTEPKTEHPQEQLAEIADLATPDTESENDQNIVVEKELQATAKILISALGILLFIIILMLIIIPLLDKSDEPGYKSVIATETTAPSIQTASNSTHTAKTAAQTEEPETELELQEPEDTDEIFRQSCEPLNYTAVMRSENEYVGMPLWTTIDVFQVLTATENGEEKAILFGKVDDGKIVCIYHVYSDEEKKIIEDDCVIVYGEFVGLYTYKTALGTSNTVPLLRSRCITNLTLEADELFGEYSDIMSEYDTADLLCTRALKTLSSANETFQALRIIPDTETVNAETYRIVFDTAINATTEFINVQSEAAAQSIKAILGEDYEYSGSRDLFLSDLENKKTAFTDTLEQLKNGTLTHTEAAESMITITTEIIEMVEIYQ